MENKYKKKKDYFQTSNKAPDFQYHVFPKVNDEI